MAWDEWEQIKAGVAERMQLNQLPPAGGAGSNVTGGLQSNKTAWNKAGDGVGTLQGKIGKALTKLETGQSGLANSAGCLTAGAQKEVYDSWARYVKSVGERCGSVKTLLQQVGSDLLKTDDSVRSAIGAIDKKYADTPALGGQK